MPSHNAMTGSELHETKGAAAASKGFTLVANGAGTAAYQALLGNVVHVNALADLPTAAAGKITLLANTIYLLGASVNIGTDFLLFSNGSSIQCLAAFTSTLTYTGTVPLFQGDNANTRIKDINVLCASSDVFSWADSTPGTSIIIVTDVLIIAAKAFGTFDDIGTLVVDGSTVVSCTDGLVFLGTINGIRLNSLNLISTDVAFIGLDFTTATLSNINIDGIVMTGGVGSIGIKGDAASANVAADRIAHVSHIQFAGVTTPVSGITINDVRWNFQSNGDLADSMPDALTSLTANATNTVIAGVSTPTLVLGTWTEVRASQYTTTAAGRITLLSERDVVTPIDVTVSLEPVSGTNKILRAYIALNGTVITASGISTHVDNADPRVISIPWQLNLSETDFIEVFVENQTDAVDILVLDATLRVR